MLTCPFAPTGTITRFPTVWPGTKFGLGVAGRAVPLGHTVRWLALLGPTAVTFSTTAPAPSPENGPGTPGNGGDPSRLYVKRCSSAQPVAGVGVARAGPGVGDAGRRDVVEEPGNTIMRVLRFDRPWDVGDVGLHVHYHVDAARPVVDAHLSAGPQPHLDQIRQRLTGDEVQVGGRRPGHPGRPHGQIPGLGSIRRRHVQHHHGRPAADPGHLDVQHRPRPQAVAGVRVVRAGPGVGDTGRGDGLVDGHGDSDQERRRSPSYWCRRGQWRWR